MATIYVTEFAELPLDKFGAVIPSPKYPAVAKQSMSITGASTTLANAFASTTHFVLIHTDSVCSIDIGLAPTAVTSGDRMPANETRFAGVRPGDNLAVITNS